MKLERKKEIFNEGIVRISKWLENSTFEEMTVYYSMIRFNMAVGMIGYPFKKEAWMLDSDFNRFVSDQEYDSPEYDDIMNNLYDIAESDGKNIINYIIHNA